LAELLHREAASSDEACVGLRVSTHRLSPKLDPRLILLCEPDSVRAASLRILRHRLIERGNPAIIAVSGPDEGSGKTTCAVNLALALSECDRAKVLLVEANLRKPAVAMLFGFLPPEGLARQLDRHRDRPLEPWFVVELGSPSLHVLAADSGQASEPLLDGPAFSQAIQRLRMAGYDYVVLDTPSVLHSADVNLIQGACDGVLMTAWAARTTGKALSQAVEQLSPSKILGIALFGS
jgi:Mrp family chromosome partitioning ATPase